MARSSPSRRRFADVRCAGYGHRDTLLDGVAQGERIPQAVDLPGDVPHRLAQFPAVGELHLFLGEVELQLQQGGHTGCPTDNIKSLRGNRINGDIGQRLIEHIRQQLGFLCRDRRCGAQHFVFDHAAVCDDDDDKIQRTDGDDLELSNRHTLHIRCNGERCVIGQVRDQLTGL